MKTPSHTNELSNNAHCDLLCRHSTNIETNRCMNSLERFNWQALFSKTVIGRRNLLAAPNHADVPCRRTEGEPQDFFVRLMPVRNDHD